MATITYNVTTVGSPTFNNGVVSDFSNSDYCYITDNVTLGSNWEIGTKGNFGSGIPDCCAISGLGNQYIALGTDPNVNGINWNIGNGSSWQNPTFVDRSIVSNTDYWFKITFNGTQYALYKSIDGEDYGSAIAYLDTTTEIPEFRLLLGTGRGLSEVAFPQWIDLKETYIKKNGVEVWRGATVSSGAGVKIQHRHDTAANWALVNPVLSVGEMGFETDTDKAKIGDGSTAWNSLDYFVPFDTTKNNLTIAKSLPRLTLSNTQSTDNEYSQLRFENSQLDITSTTAPSTNIGSFQVVGYDSNNQLIGGMTQAFNASNNLYTAMYTRRSVGGNITDAAIRIGVHSNGNAYTSAPNPPDNSNNDAIATTSFVNNQLQYKSGDTFSFTNSNREWVCPAYVTSSGKNVYFTLTLPKTLKNISTITCTSLVVAIRKPDGGYIPANDWDALTNADTVSIQKDDSNLITIAISYSSFGVTNNICLAVQIKSIGLSFS